ncbi:hypothetical protein NBRC116493_13690 [Aurantivibrio infirmus]
MQMIKLRHGICQLPLLLVLAILSIRSFSDSTEITQLPSLLSERAREAFYNNDLEKVKALASSPDTFNEPEAAYYSAMLLVRHGELLDIAFQLFTTAVEKNHSGAMFQLAQMYENGTFVEKDLVSALAWYHQSELLTALPPSLDALNIEDTEVESPLPEVKLIEALQKRANLNDPLAQLQLGLQYEKGQWLNQDVEQAIRWYEQAAKNGSDQANLNLGLFYCRGIYLEKNSELANHYFKQSDRNIFCQ